MIQSVPDGLYSICLWNTSLYGSKMACFTQLKKHKNVELATSAGLLTKNTTQDVRPELFIRMTDIAIVKDIIVTSIAGAELRWWTLSYAFNKRSAVGCRELFAGNNEFLCSFVWLLWERFKAALQRLLWMHCNCVFEFQTFIWSRKTDLYNQHLNKAHAKYLLMCVAGTTLHFCAVLFCQGFRHTVHSVNLASAIEAFWP